MSIGGNSVFHVIWIETNGLFRSIVVKGSSAAELAHGVLLGGWSVGVGQNKSCSLSELSRYTLLDHPICRGWQEGRRLPVELGNWKTAKR